MQNFYFNSTYKKVGNKLSGKISKFKKNFNKRKLNQLK